MSPSRLRFRLPAACLLATLSIAASHAVAQQTKESPPPLGTASFVPPESKKQEPLTPENFIVRAAIANLAEIQASELALKKSGDSALRALASRLVRDHQQAQGKLKAVAAEAKVALPGTVDEDTRKRQQQLKELVGADFDRAYLALMHEGHTQTLELYEQAAAANLPPSFKSYARETSNVVRTHRTELEKLRTQQQR
jgi:putative membrane protein